ncbi:hypothetical protein K0U83_18635, partial [bacterium]|nr:hypothetical protein [bacterium]
ALTVPGNVTASVSETGDTVSAALSNVVQLFANVPETGDTVSAALGELAAASVSANVPETGDTVAAWIGLPPAGKFVRVTVGPREFRATVGKREFRV